MIRIQRQTHQALSVVNFLILASIASACPNAPYFSGVGFLPGGMSGNQSNAFAVSADGLAVVGGSSSANVTEGCLNLYSEAFRWREDTGIVALGDFPNECFESRALGTTSDGSLVVGEGTPSISFKEAFRWTEASGMVGLSDLGLGWIDSEASGVSDDGSIIIGNCQPSTLDRACTWTSGAGWVLVAGLGLQNASQGWAISNNGTWVTGWWRSSVDFQIRPFRWSSSTGAATPGGVSGTNYGYGTDISDNGTVVGYTDSNQPFEWTAASAFVILGNGIPNAISPDATLIGGYYYDASVATLHQAAIWDASRTRHRAADILVENGVAVPCGWILSTVSDIVMTCGVVTMTGSGMNPNGEIEGWIARYVPGSTAVNRCDDGNLCTVDDNCDSGPCTGTPIDCSGFDDICNVGVCNAGTGQCDAQPANEGGACDDGDPDTSNDVCNNGVCEGVPDQPHFGDLNGDTIVSIDDILCMLSAFAGNGGCAGGLANADIVPCAGDGAITIDDILAVLAAFAGVDPCP